jgi:hypothetical protein
MMYNQSFARVRHQLDLRLTTIKIPDSGWSGNLERAMGLEPTTSSLGSWHSTIELRPLTSKAD